MKTIKIDLNDIDLNYQPTVTPPKWEPTIKLKPYQELTKVYLDIETTGLDPDFNKVIMIGLRDHLGEDTVIYAEKEQNLLKIFIEVLKVMPPDVLIGHNVFNFDLPFLMRRCEIHGIEHGFHFGKLRTITSASHFGKPIQFKPVHIPLKTPNFKEIQIIDTFQQIAIWDKSASKLTNYKLKPSVLTLKLRAEQRLELSNEQIQECYKTGDLESIRKYLVYDLEDTELLANFLIPVIYYQMLFVPGIELQNMAISSPAIKAQKIHESLIPKTNAVADETTAYEGAKVALHKPGLHRNIAKIDVSSLYPSIMLRYGICSRKDPEHKFLGVLDYMREERLKQKKLAATDPIANHQQNALKILINGSYGYFGTGGYTFNDYHAAAMVTAYGRKILNLMEDTIVTHGGELVESDTDGIIFISETPEQIFEAVQKVLPSGISIELEFKNCIASVPKAKNYTILKPDGKVVAKGAKRSELPLIKDFRIDYLKAYAKSENEAEEYCQRLIKEIESGSYPIEKLTITRKIAKSEKKLVEIGLGKINETVSYFYGDYFGQLREVKKGKYCPHYYVDKIIETRTEITGSVEDSTTQLSLFG